ncbi:MAG: HD domain-containing protein [Calditrichaeota bacterium]|nr:MAG: HD domain-containing protein [Calditrichota bacterium]
MLNHTQKLNRLVEFGIEISNVSDLDLVLEKVLSEARFLFKADAGSIYIREGEKLRFSISQNDTLQQRLPKGKKLIYTSFTLPINNNSIAGYVANNDKTLNIPDVYKLNKGLPYSFNPEFDKLSGYHTQSMLTIPMKNTRHQIIGVLQLINAQNDQGEIIPFDREDEPIVKHFAIYAANAIERAQMTRDTIERMISMAELRDPKETGPHANRVAAYAVELYEAYATKQKLPPKEIERTRDALRMAAMLHDVGKVAISDTILKKPGKLTDEEYEIMKQHTIHGACLFLNPRSDFDEYSAIVALNHHERWDGKGYPGHVDPKTGKPLPGYEDENGRARGKKGEEIPLFGRIVALADVYDALSSNRVYKEAWSEEKVLQIIEQEKGHQFDPELVDCFFSRLDVIRSIASRYPDEKK